MLSLHNRQRCFGEQEWPTQIDADYAGRELLLVGVLKGAIMVMADLARALHSQVRTDWMAVSSYGSGTKSSGVVRILKDLDTDITDRHVLVVEDIIDSGLTLSWLVGNLRSRGPASVEVCVMLRKPAAAQMDVPVSYIGFDTIRSEEYARWAGPLYGLHRGILPGTDQQRVN